MHRTTARFWRCFEKPPPPVRSLARENFQLFKNDSRHPSLHFKKIGKFWSVRVGMSHRALAVKDANVLFGYELGIMMNMNLSFNKIPITLTYLSL